MEAIGIEQKATLTKNETLNFPTIQSFWYKHQRGTREKYKYNQFLFVEGKKRFVKRNAEWMYAPLTEDNYHQEPVFELLNNTNPISEFVEDKEKKEHLLAKEKEFDAFSSAMKMA
jgi:hypothetical protein